MKFPVSKLKPQSAKFIVEDGLEELQVQFEYFSIPEPHELGDVSLKFEAPMRAEGISILLTNPSKLQGKYFDFPTNPKPGYIDASVYFANAHNPIDISKIEFGDLQEEKIWVTVTSRWLMSFEGTGFDDFDFTFTVPLFVQQPYKLPLTQRLWNWIFK